MAVFLPGIYLKDGGSTSFKGKWSSFSLVNLGQSSESANWTIQEPVNAPNKNALSNVDGTKRHAFRDKYLKLYII